jgi:AcrR family transcriptional regulator
LTNLQFLPESRLRKRKGIGVTQLLVKPRERAGLVNQNGQRIGAKGQRTRQRLIEATVELLATRGLRDLTVAEVTREAETSPATFYVYFEGVPEVVLGALADCSQTPPDLIALLEADWRDDGAAQARAFVALYCNRWAANATVFRVRNLAAEEGDERFIAARRAAAMSILDPLARKIDSARFAKRISPTQDSRASAAVILMLLERLAAVGPMGLIDAGPGFDKIQEAAADMIGHALGVV